MTDQQLVQGCIEGDIRFQRLLYDHFVEKMKGVCLRYSANEEEAEDVLQEGFIIVFRKIDSFKGEGALGGWIRKIMVNTALQHYRKNKYMRVTSSYEGKEDYFIENDNVIEDMAANELLQKIQQLPDGYRMVFNLYAIEGYTHREIGEQLGISEGTSKSQFSRARSILKKMIEAENPVYYNEKVG